MNVWVSSGLLGCVVLAVGLAAPGCSSPERDFASRANAGASAATSGASGKTGGVAGTSGASQSFAEAGMGGDGTVDVAGAGGEPSTIFDCGGVTCAAEATCIGADADAHCVCPKGYTDAQGDGTLCQEAPGEGCRWSCSGSNCTRVALDSDGDGHGSSACVAAPGDDCDDTQAAIFPGAPELCDGLDNDCDKKIDLSDGLSLVGAIKDVPNRDHVSIAAGGDGTFGTVSISPPGANGLFWGTISAAGAGTFYEQTLFSPSSDTTYSRSRMAWANGIGQYGVVYRIDGFGGSGSRGGVMDVKGCCWKDFNLPGSANTRSDVTARGQGDLLYLATGDANLNLAARDASGFTLSSNLTISGSWDTSYDPRVAASGTTAGVIWQTLSPRALNWSLISATLAFGSPEQLATAANYADIAAIGAGYGLAWIEGLGFRFAIKQPNGATQCTSSVISFGSVPSNQQVAVADSANGTVVVATSPDSNLIHLYRFDSSCKVIDDTDVTTTANAPTEPRVVLGGGHLMVVWTDATKAHYRFLSDLLCH